MYRKRWNELRLLILYFSSSLLQESGALRCHSCVSLKSDRLEDCGNWPSPAHEGMGQIIRTTKVEKKKKTCVKVKIQAVDKNGQEISMAIRYAETPLGHQQANQSQPAGSDDGSGSNDGSGKCISALSQKDVHFATEYLLKQDNLSLTLVEICKCSNTDFCNGEDKIIPHSSIINFIILISGLTHKFFTGLLL